ncbi:G-protein coupled receptor Mth2-like [Diorhabda sublineata]|uniref:G-protein coupled receptor Mth2-like n=1 Tax=Diorhabda sublineata TaxID=1163346 RepID=UPI0024E10CD3|nr:G-protein coupled receptor Mth2-like [Diorhabda sublineata]XP_056646705.1 G-protein coupled receptor Mth2-like [Diorhabda sublineata]XP_056646706.1 G-protein coupled receptor Mth2-like [Diorhabda sublineata]XP_056646707.1 G-protein coupled receptor Mth2-like [Diorhabda sublineata]
MRMNEMIFQTIFLVILSKSHLINGMSNCCQEPNILLKYGHCKDGSMAKELNCKNKFYSDLNDSSITYTENNGDIKFDDFVLSPDQYCKTFFAPKNTEVFLICADESESDEWSRITRTVFTVLQLISVFFIILTIIVYLVAPFVLYLQDLVLLHTLSGMAIAYLTLSIINLSGYIREGLCEFLAYLLYFSFMYCFFWLNVLCFHIWREVIQPKCLVGIKNWKLLYHIYSIGSPILAICWLLFVHFGRLRALEGIHPGIGISRCWFQSTKQTNIYFIGPISVLLMMNIIFFIWTMIELWNRSKRCTETKIHKYRLRLYVKLFFIMGITWIFEIFSTIFEDKSPNWLWLVTDIVNALQGVIIFLLLVIFRKTIKRTLANRKFIVWRFPPQWKNERDSECEELDEDISLETKTRVNIDF